MTTTLYVPRDTTALALGADAVAARLERAARQRSLDLRIVRNGSRGLCWLEPLVEVETPEGRFAFGPVEPEDVESLIDAGLFEAGLLDVGRLEAERLEGLANHPLSLGLTEEIPYLKAQQRLTFSRIGVTDPVSLEDYTALRGFEGLRNALTFDSQTIVDEVKTSGLRGRGGAAFPTAIKWQTVHDQPPGQKYIVCNADEGDSGTFADRLIMECDPYLLIEGMVIAGLAVGATQGYVYLRSEYPVAHAIFEEAVRRAYEAGYLGDDILGSARAFHIEVRLGAGAYICGEETSLLESLEGKRGLVRAKPPLPAIEGLFGRPTVVNNVLTLAAVPFILDHGGQTYADYGMGKSRGTLALQLAGNVKRGGLVELAFGVTLRELMENFGGGTRSGRPLKAVQVGGPLGAYLPASQWDSPIDYETFAAFGGVVGHGGVVMFDDSVDMGDQARFAMEFCSVESCGKCTPCRIGAVRGVEVIDRIRAGESFDKNLALLADLCDTMVDGSLCAMGGMTPFPVQSVMKHFPNDLTPRHAEGGR